MFYHYLRLFYWFSNVFGLHFPFLSKCDKMCTRCFSLWSFIVSVLFIVSYFYPNNFWSVIKAELYLEQISIANNVIVNVGIILLNICYGGRINRNIYAAINRIFRDLQIDSRNLKLLAIKLQVWLTPPLAVFITAIIIELIYVNPPYTLIIKMPVFLSLTHLILLLSVILAVLNVVNLRMSEKPQIHNNFILEDYSKTKNLLHYFLCPTIKMFEANSNNRKGQNDLYFLCKIYDEIGICLTMLENSHGIQMILSIWLMFSNAVTGITLVTKERANIVWIVVVRSALPFYWFFIGCYVDNQLRKQVERIEMLIVKHLIDFRCDNSTREALQTFKQVVGANRLEFTACNLFRLNYATILGTIVNVITYSIILIQVL